MKQIIIMALAGIFILAGCKSKEEKALEAIKDEMFKTLYDFESYQPVETKIDSAFLSIYTDSTILKHGYVSSAILDEVNTTLEEVKDGNRTAKIWSDSYSSYGREQYNEAREKAEKGLKKLDIYFEAINAHYDTIRQVAQNINPDFYGWKVTHKFRCKTKGGNSTLGTYIYIFDKKIKNIIYKEDTEDEELTTVKGLIKEAIEEKAKKENADEESNEE